MKVRLAAEMLSSSVADALEYLKNAVPEFRNAGPTIEFIRYVSEDDYPFYIKLTTLVI